MYMAFTGVLNFFTMHLFAIFNLANVICPLHKLSTKYYVHVENATT